MLNLAMRSTTPQRVCEEDGLDCRENLREWAQAIRMCREIEKEFKLEEGELDFLLEGRFLTTSSGEEVTGEPPVGPEETPAQNRLRRLFMNRIKELSNG